MKSQNPHTLPRAQRLRHPRVALRVGAATHQPLPASRQTASEMNARVLSCAKRYRSTPLLSGISSHAAAALATDKPAQINIMSRNPNTNAPRTDSLIAAPVLALRLAG